MNGFTLEEIQKIKTYCVRQKDYELAGKVRDFERSNYAQSQPAAEQQDTTETKWVVHGIYNGDIYIVHIEKIDAPLKDGTLTNLGVIQMGSTHERYYIGGNEHPYKSSQFYPVKVQLKKKEEPFTVIQVSDELAERLVQRVIDGIVEVQEDKEFNILGGLGLPCVESRLEFDSVIWDDAFYDLPVTMQDSAVKQFILWFQSKGYDLRKINEER